ncbi:J domain-containing protein [Candidatus Fermentibacterales bacterium]|nr:J domain-containing protein [Candidatus Fermentibacterales bacterium]
MSEGDPTFYEILGVSTDASMEDIERVYFELARKYHPDVAGNSPDATAKFMLINEAYQILRTPESRSVYDAESGLSERGDQRSSGSGPIVTSSATEVGREESAQPETRLGAVQRVSPELRKAISQAERMCRSGDFWQAYDSLMKWVVQYPRQAALRRALAKAAEGKNRLHDAANHLIVAREVEYFNADNHALLGSIYLKGKQWGKARDCFNDALSWNEEHVLARDGLKEVEEELEKQKPVVQRLLGKLSASMKKRKQD